MPDQLQPVAADTTSYLTQVDPRARVIAAVVLSIVVALADDFRVLATALAAAALGAAISRLPWQTVLRRLLPLNVVMLLLGLMLPLTTPGTSLLEFGSLEFSREGLLLSARVALKGNAIVLTLLVLLGPMDANSLGHALSHLRVPDKLTHLMLFTIRYLDVLHQEYRRMRSAMRTRGFRPRMDRHTYRTFGNLVGMLLVRSFDRSERVVAAMKCRGFRGRFYLLDHFHFRRRDVPFCVATTLLLCVLIWVEWL